MIAVESRIRMILFMRELNDGSVQLPWTIERGCMSGEGL